MMPRYSWEVEEDGTISVFTLDKPSQVLLWQAHNPEQRNFMQAQIGRAYQSTLLEESEPGIYRVRLDAPESGYTAYYVELEFESGLSIPFKFSTGTKVVPDVVEHEWVMAPANARD